MDNYPLGANTPDAPWNQTNEEKEIEVTVSITLSKTFKILVSDYTIVDSGKDEDGEYFKDIDYSDCDLKRAVNNQITLPNEAYLYIGDNPGYFSKQYNDLKDWNVDGLEVIPE